MKHLSLLIAAVALVLTQCERHSWEDVTDEHGHVTEKGTKRLFEEHGGGESHAAALHGDHQKEGPGHEKKSGDAEVPEADQGGDTPAEH